MGVEARPEPDGAVTIRVQSAALQGQELQAALLNLQSRAYLTESGWAAKRRTFARVVADGDTVNLRVEPEAAARVPAGTRLTLEDTALGFRGEFTWPVPPPSSPAPHPAVPDTTASVTGPPPPFAARAEVPPRRWSALAVAGALALGLLAGIGGAALTLGRPADPNPAEAAERAADTEALARQRDDLAAREARVAEAEKALAQSRPDTASDAAGAEVKSLETRRWPLANREGQLARGETALREARAGMEARITRLTTDLEAREKSIRSLTAERDDYLRMTREARQHASDLQAQLNARSPVPHTRAVWGAATRSSDNANIFVVLNELDEPAALKAARAACYFATDNKNCPVIASFQNACFALARPEDRRVRFRSFGFAFGGNDISDLERTALAKCEGQGNGSCSFAYTVCSPDTLAPRE